MSKRDIIGWLALIVAGLFAFALLASAWDNLTAWLPWSDESKLARSERDREYAEQDAINRGAEAKGNAAVSESLEQTHRIVVEARSVTARAEQEARLAPDAETPLGPRGDRLRGHDRQLCDLVPGSCTAPAGSSGDSPVRQGPVPDLHPAE